MKTYKYDGVELVLVADGHGLYSGTCVGCYFDSFEGGCPEICGDGSIFIHVNENAVFHEDLFEVTDVDDG